MVGTLRRINSMLNANQQLLRSIGHMASPLTPFSTPGGARCIFLSSLRSRGPRHLHRGADLVCTMALPALTPRGPSLARHDRGAMGQVQVRRLDAGAERECAL